MKQGVKVKLNPFLFAIPSICDPPGCSSWYEMLESTLSTFFPVSLIKVLLKAVRDKERLRFRDGGGISRVFFLHVSMTDGKCFRGKSAQVAAKNSVCKCTWQMQEKKTPQPPAWELPYSIPFRAHDMALYFDNVSWQAQVSQFDQHRVRLSPRGSSLQTLLDCQIWFHTSTSPGDTLKYNKVMISYFSILYLQHGSRIRT